MARISLYLVCTGGQAKNRMSLSVENASPGLPTTTVRRLLLLAKGYGSVKVAVLLSRLVSGNAPLASSGLTVKVSVPPGIQR
jgi:hypothetical protein